MWWSSISPFQKCTIIVHLSGEAKNRAKAIGSRKNLRVVSGSVWVSADRRWKGEMECRVYVSLYRVQAEVQLQDSLREVILLQCNEQIRHDLYCRSLDSLCFIGRMTWSSYRIFFCLSCKYRWSVLVEYTHCLHLPLHTSPPSGHKHCQKYGMKLSREHIYRLLYERHPFEKCTDTVHRQRENCYKIWTIFLHQCRAPLKGVWKNTPLLTTVECTGP